MTGQALVIGEALIDVVRRTDGTQDAYVGGSPANVAVGLARLGREAELLTWIGADEYGTMIRERLAEDNVFLARGSERAARTSVATATLDTSGAATYDFDLEWDVSPEAAPADGPIVVHTGSIAAVLTPGAPAVLAALAARRETATVTYDPNVRPTLMGSPDSARAVIDGAVALSDVVKVSDEDLEWLRPDESVEEQAARWLELGPRIVVVTRGGDGATGFSRGGVTVTVPAPPVTVADTVGAGDSFMAGLIDGLWTRGLLGAHKREELSAIDAETLEWVLRRCARIAAITVSREGANPPTNKELGEA